MGGSDKNIRERLLIGLGLLPNNFLQINQYFSLTSLNFEKSD